MKYLSTALFLLAMGVIFPALAEDKVQIVPAKEIPPAATKEVKPIEKSKNTFKTCPKQGEEAIIAVQRAAERKDDKILSMCLTEVLQDLNERLKDIESKQQ